MADAVRTTTLRNYLKETTGLRTSAGAASKLTELSKVMFEDVAQRSRERAMGEDRSTLLDRDVEAAWQDFLKASKVCVGWRPH